jgi:hypothetical protein
VRALVLALAFAGCGGGNPSVPDAAAGDGGSDAATSACTTDADCADGVFCNGDETCSAGRCTPHPRACDDGIACTVDACVEAMQRCVSTAPDADADGVPDAACHDGSGVALGTDCDDHDAMRFPGNTETCDAHDEDCDDSTLGGMDADHDGAVPDTCCNGALGSPDRRCGGDCDDTNAAISPIASDVCDTVDNDCDGMIDEHVSHESWVDGDADGYGDASTTPELVCTVPSSRATQGGDCDDTNGAVHPTAVEACNTVDDDCDFIIDEGGTC